VLNNIYDCGITLASHHFSLTPAPDYGVHHNAIVGNKSVGNGTATGDGAGIGLFAAPPGAQTYSNSVVGNEATGNALPGVAMHSHSPGQNLNNNLIAANRISGNGPDPDPGTTVPTGISVFADEAAGASSITGTTITANIFQNESISIAVKTSGTVEAHLNNFDHSIGVDNLDGGKVNATLNWWGCPNGPGASGCGTVSGTGVTYTPWLHWF